MKTVRRLYFYAVTLVSLEVVLWGLIGLARSALTPSLVGGSSTRLAQALALILVGLPVFLVHWLVAQRNAREDMEEHASGVRAFFLYATLLSILVPIVQNLITLTDHILLKVTGQSPYLVMFNPSLTWGDNLVAILMNALVAVYFLRVLRQDWQSVTPQDALTGQRRLYRFVWVVYALALMVSGVQQLLRFILVIPSSQVFSQSSRVTFVNGLSLLLVGTPLFLLAWKTAQDALTDESERTSLLRLGLLYVLSLTGVVTVLSSGGLFSNVVFRLALGDRMALPAFLNAISKPLAIGIPMAGVWAYFGRWLNRSLVEVPEAPRRAGLHRLYYYLLSAIGLVATFIGLNLILLFIIDSLLADVSWATSLRPHLSAALAVLLVSFPLWWRTWRPMQQEAIQVSDSGDHARRSLVRRIYIYLALFASVIGGMIVTGAGLFLLLRSLLGDVPTGLLRSVLADLDLLLLFVLLGLYHGFALRHDGRMSAEALNRRHAAFPVLLLDPGDPSFVADLTGFLSRQLPHLPVQVHPVSQPLSSDQQATLKAVLLPGELAFNPPPHLAAWLQGFLGIKLVLPRSAKGWLWSVNSPRNPQDQFRQVGLLLRQLAEGQEARLQSPASGWMVAFYILLGLILSPILVSLLAQFIFR